MSASRQLPTESNIANLRVETGKCGYVLIEVLHLQSIGLVFNVIIVWLTHAINYAIKVVNLKGSDHIYSLQY
uniref:Uncharacterized protein n=1 Tax=Arundo donax TaxID=35708 RepID=A0A0A9DRB3_ARUDO